MREPFSPRDLLLGAKWTSALFTTYSLSLSFFESVPFAAMARTVRDATVLTDVAGYAASLSEAGALGAGRDYEVIPIAVAGGVFHPKIAVLMDEDGAVRAMVGSGNLSFGGWGYNTEVVDVLVPGTDSIAYGDLGRFLGDLAALTGPDDLFLASRKPELSAFIEACTRQGMQPGSGTSRLLHSLSGRSLAAQIADMANDLGGALSLTVVSPFFSAHRGVELLALQLGVGRVSVAVPLKTPTIFDFVAARAAGFDVAPVICDGFDDDKRPLHAKLFDIECRRGRLLVSGSANATIPALAGDNVEAVVARVVSRATTLGWRPAAIPPRAAGLPLEHDMASKPCLAAHVRNGKVYGLLFGVHAAGGMWRASLRCGSAVVECDAAVEVTERGRFQFSLQGYDPTGFPTAAQVVLEQHDVEARGWLMQDALLRAIKAKGPGMRAVARMLSGEGVAADVVAVLEYFAQSPASLIEAAVRQGGGRDDRRPPMAPSTVPIAAWKFDPVGAFDKPSPWAGDAGGIGDASLMDALVRYLATSMPDPSDAGEEAEDGLDAHDEMQEGDEQKDERKHSPRAWVPEPLFRRAFDQMALMLATIPVGTARAPGLHLLFDMVVMIAPRCEEADELTRHCFESWMKLARGCRVNGAAFDPLDRSAAVVLTKWTMDGVRRPEFCHGELQRWFGRELDPAIIAHLEPDPDNPDRLEERRLSPETTVQVWQKAWSAMTSAVTAWARVNALYTALQTGALWECPAGAEPREESVLRCITSGSKKIDRLGIITKPLGKTGACPRCSYTLPVGDLHRLRATRIASCCHCQRVLLDVSL